MDNSIFSRLEMCEPTCWEHLMCVMEPRRMIEFLLDCVKNRYTPVKTVTEFLKTFAECEDTHKQAFLSELLNDARACESEIEETAACWIINLCVRLISRNHMHVEGMMSRLMYVKNANTIYFENRILLLEQATKIVSALRTFMSSESEYTYCAKRKNLVEQIGKIKDALAKRLC